MKLLTILLLTAATVSADELPPLMLGTLPNGLVFENTTTEIDLQVITDETASCRFDTERLTEFSEMSYTLDSLDQTTHTAIWESPTPGESRALYARCKDVDNNINTDPHTLYYVMEPLPLDPPGGLHNDRSTPTFRWTASTSDQIVGYIIYYSSEGVQEVVQEVMVNVMASEGTSYTFPQLAYGTYTISIAAYNDYANPSERSPAITYEVY